VGTGFRKRSRFNNKIERDDDSKKSHPALGGGSREPATLQRVLRTALLALQVHVADLAHVADPSALHRGKL
jgi:hypothetical protein